MIKFTTMNNSIYLLLFMVHCLLSPASSVTHPLPPLASLRGTLFEEKTRLGSRPPSCHNRCNQCHPCMAMQVPTMPSRDRVVGPGTTRTLPMMFLDPSHNRYSNYKPLGWKCHCGDHFFNP